MSQAISSAAAVFGEGSGAGKGEDRGAVLPMLEDLLFVSPLGFVMAPSRSAMAITIAPASRQNFAAW